MLAARPQTSDYSQHKNPGASAEHSEPVRGIRAGTEPLDPVQDMSSRYRTFGAGTRYVESERFDAGAFCIDVCANRNMRLLRHFICCFWGRCWGN